MRIHGALVAAFVLLALGAPRLEAQALDRVDELVRLGRAEDARAVLQEWWQRERDGAPQRDQQRGLWLRGRLTTDPSLAELDFQRLVVLYPSSPYAPQALLRLAQSAHAHGDVAGAERHVAAIVRDYPASSVRGEAEAWLRAAGAPPVAMEAAATAGGSPAAASSTAPAGGGPSAPSGTTSPPASGQASSPAPASQPAASPPNPAPSTGAGGQVVIRPAEPRPPAPADAVLDWSVQFGAFTDQDRAFALHGQLFDAGLAARLVRVAGSGFLHVRIGRFATRAEASQELQRVTALGYTAAIVRDDRPEELVRR